MEYLKTSGKCKSLAKLNPFLHNDILMLGGRVGNAETHRPILPYNHAVTELIINIIIRKKDTLGYSKFSLQYVNTFG